ncbi:hypothetical protein CROQUDRAFT_93994 [Cronartium quercuum f. sp. fusiforme G11]|uniref:Uncharacterized protein n=1 Tax=Cronartium quercuum f. sp. fusiforme G11 TaxID=708437 RepID=A0A9P6TC45_9BASI|nr:hypothetical protein CROQUDRAFT_93994 [Cronartium quercuum f. sp. fusiforme G11]
MMPVSAPSIMIGIEEYNHNYHLLDLESEKQYVTHDATFQPLVFPARKVSNQYNDNWHLTEEETIEEVESQESESEDRPEKPRSLTEDELPPLIIPIDQGRQINEGKESSMREAEEFERDEDESYDDQIELEITPPPEPLRRLTRERNQPQRFTPGTNHTI